MFSLQMQAIPAHLSALLLFFAPWRCSPTPSSEREGFFGAVKKSMYGKNHYNIVK